MTENVKKGTRNYCVILFFLLLLTGNTESQQVGSSASSINNREEIDFYDEEQNNTIEPDSEEEPEEEIEEEAEQSSPNKIRRISAIKIHGNVATSKDAILNHIPYKVGETFDPRKTKTLISNLYFKLKKFRNIKVMGEVVNDAYMNLHVFVEEKYPLKELKTVGNKKVSEKEIAKKIELANITTIDPEELKIVANKIK